MTLSILQNNFSKKIFPYCPGIFWPIKNGKYISTNIDYSKLNNLISNNNLKIICYGGLFESFFSLSIIEAFHKKGFRNLYWLGNKNFEKIIYWNGLAKFSDSFDKNILNNFTIPLFKDLDHNVYCNSLFNYREVSTYYNFPGYHDKSPAAKQIFKNSTLDWDMSYIPKIRCNFNAKKESKLIVIIPEKTNFSTNNINCCDLTNFQLNALCTMLIQKNYEILILSKNNYYFNKNCRWMPVTMENIFSYLPLADCIISRDIDFLLLALCISHAKIIYSFPIRKNKIKEFILDSNYHYLYNQYSTKNNIVNLKDFFVEDIYSKIVDL